MRNGPWSGALLREWREAKGLSIDELSRATRILPRFLHALEEDRLDDLPAPVFVRGFIRAYCASVGRSPGEPLARYDARVGPPAPTARVLAAVAARPPANSPVTRARRPPAVWSLAGSRARTMLIAAVLLIIVGGALYRLAPLAGTAPVPPPAPARLPAPVRSPEPVLENSTVQTTSPAAAPATWSAATATPAPAPPPLSHVLLVRAHDATWVQVRPDDGAVSEALLQPGTVREWRGTERFTITLGNAGGVSLELDGVLLPPIGNRGEVVRNLTLPAEAMR
ncbi:MAG TPA: helix-turn-helix domain-containing protein [Methylomirabilota bacterium]|jgi:cytoskeleton protein RodZ|nr:helix-turn-helix domain-containing protein [Methylomirabilota bacterium]